MNNKEKLVELLLSYSTSNCMEIFYNEYDNNTIIREIIDTHFKHRIKSIIFHLLNRNSKYGNIGDDDVIVRKGLEYVIYGHLETNPISVNTIYIVIDELSENCIQSISNKLEKELILREEKDE